MFFVLKLSAVSRNQHFHFFFKVYSVVANVVRLKMFERLPNGREIVVNEQLVNLQFADKAEEPYLSKVGKLLLVRQMSVNGAMFIKNDEKDDEER